jgi:RNA polymerase sigma-70 factor (ECF subfamily)
LTDEDIIQLFWDRSESAVAHAQAKYGRYCLKIARGIVNDSRDAQECVNDTWLRAWNSIPPERPGVLRLFLGKITRNLSLDRLRRQGAEKRSGAIVSALEELEECVAGTASTENEALSSLLADSINDFLAALPKKEREIFLRRYFYGNSVKAISRRMCVTQGCVYTSLSRSRAKLRSHLEKEGYVI